MQVAKYAIDEILGRGIFNVADYSIAVILDTPSYHHVNYLVPGGLYTLIPRHRCSKYIDYRFILPKTLHIRIAIIREFKLYKKGLGNKL